MRRSPARAATAPDRAAAHRAAAWWIPVLAAAAVFAVAALSAGAARADGVALGDPLVIAAGETIEDDVLVVGGDVHVEGTVGGDAVAINGDVVVRGRVRGDALALAGTVRLEPGARVDGNAFALLGRVVPDDAAAGESVGGQVRSILAPSPDTGDGYLALSWSRPVLLLRLGCILFWTCAALIAAFAAPSSIVHAAAEARRHPLRLGAIGLLVHVSLALLFVLFVALVALFIGLPLLFLLIVAWVALEAGALASVMHAIGDRLTDRANEPVSGYSKLLIGAFLLASFSFVPLLGELIWLAAILVGSGALAITRLRPGHRPVGHVPTR